MKHHSTSSSKSSTDLTQPTGEEGAMPSDSDESPHLYAPFPPLSTVSDDSSDAGTKIDLILNDPPCQGDEDAAQMTTLLKDNVEFVKDSKEIVGVDGGPPESESWEAQDAETFELSGKTGEEEHKKNVDDLDEFGGEEMEELKDNSVAVPREIAIKAALTYTMKQKQSTSSPKSFTNVSQPTAEEGKMPSDSDDSCHLHSPLPPLPTVSDMSVSMESALPVEQPLNTSIQGNNFVQEIYRDFLSSLEDFLAAPTKGNASIKKLDDQIKKLNEMMEEHSKNVALTNRTEQPLQSSNHCEIQSQNHFWLPRAKARARARINLPKYIAGYPSKKRIYPFADCSASSDCINNSVEDNVDPGQLEDKTNPPESESSEAQGAEAEAESSELSGKTGEEDRNKNVDDLNGLDGEEMKELDNSEAVQRGCSEGYPGSQLPGEGAGGET